MDSERPLTIESFFEYCSESMLMAACCRNCGKLFMPPREVCSSCFSSELKWVQLKGTGELVTYTVVHVASNEYQKLAPYAIGIVRFPEGVALSGLIRNVSEKELRIGMMLQAKYEHVQSDGWRPKSRYYFVPI